MVEPHLNGPGGDVPVIVHDARKGTSRGDLRPGPAPAGATIAHYRGLGLDLVPGTGLLAGCVPGTFETWMLLLRDYGTMTLADVLAPAISYAHERPSAGRARQRHHRHGRAAVPRALADLGRGLSAGRQGAGARHAVHQQGDGRDLHAHPARGRKRGRRPRAQQIERARKIWSQGFVAEAIDRFCRTQDVMDTSGERHRGVLTADDMARWQPTSRRRSPTTTAATPSARPALWSQGPVMLQQLALLKGFDLDGVDPTSADFIHTVVECSKLAFADRETFYGDPDFVEVPMATLLSDAYNAERRKLVGERASLEQRPGTVAGFGKARHRRRSASARGAGAGEPTVGAGLDARRGRSEPGVEGGSTASARCAATPCISTSSTAPATWSRRRRRAAGCNPRR